MKNDILLAKDKRFTLEEYIPLASHIMTLIAAAAEGVDEIKETFTISELGKVLEDMSDKLEGEFEFRETDSGHYQVVYKPYDDIDEEDFDGEYVLTYSVKPFDSNLNDKKDFVWYNGEKILEVLREPKFSRLTYLLYFHLGFVMHSDESFAISHNIKFEKIIESCREAGKDFIGPHQTTLMRTIADLEDMGLVKWNSETRTFQLLYITPYDPTQMV